MATSDRQYWMDRERKIGVEIDEQGYPLLTVVYYGDTPEGVISEPIPSGLKNPKWDFESKQWVEGDDDGEG